MPIDINDYSHTAAQRGWGSGWPSCGGALSFGLAVVAGPRSGVRVSVNRRIARLVSLLLAETERRGYLMRAGQCGGYNCFAGETLVMTPDGDVPLRDLAGTSPFLLSRRGTGRAAGGPGRWVQAPVRSFGTQPLRRVVLARRGIRREVFATPDHRWILDEPDRQDQERTTDELRAGDRLASVHPQPVATRVGLSSVGAAHGIVFGDGTIAGGEARVMLCGEKKATLLRYFAQPHVLAHDDGLLVGRLPKAWKRLPSRDEGSSYLYGFLAGYFAAGGDVAKNGRPRLSSSSRENLESVRILCTRLGIATTGVIDTKRIGIDGEPSSLFSISLSGRHLTDDFFLIPEHRNRFVAAPTRYHPAHWRVVSVEPTDRVEEVFCAVVPESESFALADNLLTGNCRAIAGTNVASNHSWGLAIDINSLANPYVSPRRTDHPPWMPPLWNRYGFAWGGNYNNDGRTGPADSMHYEFMGTPGDADAVTALAMTEIGGAAPPPAAAVAGKDEPVAVITLSPGADGSFRAAVMAETGDVSVVVARSWITFGTTYGSSTFTITAIDGLARPMIQRGFTVANNGSGFLELPNGCKLATVEGKATPGAVPAAALIVKTK